MTFRRLAAAAIGLSFCALCRPASGQIVQPALSLNNNIGNALVYDPMSFGRGQVTFQFFVTSSNATSLDTTLTATLPAGLSFASTNTGTATVTGDEASGEVVAVNLGQLSGPLYGYTFAATVGPLPADGAQLAVSFQLSGHASGTTDLQFSNVITFTVQAGYLPVGVYLANASALCHGTVGSALTGYTRFSPTNLSSGDGSRIAASVSDASGATAAAGTDALPVIVAGGGSATLVGEIGGAGSVVTIPGIGYRAQSQGGVFFVVDVSNNFISAYATSSNADCQQTADIEFNNPNAYAVPLTLDQRVSQYSAAGNEAAKDPLSGVKFGYPGNADGSSGGIATDSVFYRFLYKPGGNTEETTVDDLLP